MRPYFDGEEDGPEAGEPRRDTEVTLGVGGVLGFCFALVIVCALCFGWGYSMGHRGAAKHAASSTAAPDQEPLLGNNTIPKPSAAETPAPPEADSSSTTAAAETDAASQAATLTANAQGPAASGESVQGPQAAAGINAAQVQPALPGAANTAPAQPGNAPSVRPVLPNQPQSMVQVAAVANTEDAEVLETALCKRGYPVTAARDPADGLIHVRIGPFSSQDEAIRWRDKLLGDGYNAQVQP